LTLIASTPLVRAASGAPAKEAARLREALGFSRPLADLSRPWAQVEIAGLKSANWQRSGG
jgi:hypothetical protein